MSSVDVLFLVPKCASSSRLVVVVYIVATSIDGVPSAKLWVLRIVDETKPLVMVTLFTWSIYLKAVGNDHAFCHQRVE